MYENVTYPLILERMLSRVSDQFDKREGSLIWDTHSPTAIEFQLLYLELDAVLRESFGDTASREFLILHCKTRGIEPYPATKAILKGLFTPTDTDVLGKRFNGNGLNYVAIKKIKDGEYQVQCETAGSIGNRYLGQMIPVDYVRGLETAKLTEVLIPGEDAEETEHLRQRYFDSFAEKAFGGNIKDYQEKTNAIPGVGSTKVTRVWNQDIHPYEMIPNTAVKTWYHNVLDTLQGDVAKWLTAVYTAGASKKLTTGGTVLLTILDSEYNPATKTLIDTVQKAIDPVDSTGEGDGLAPIGHVVSVESARKIVIQITTNITFDIGFSWDNLQNSIQTAVSNYLLELRKEWVNRDSLIVRVSQIETRILAIAGVVDITQTSINGRGENLVLGKYEVPVFGGVSG